MKIIRNIPNGIKLIRSVNACGHFAGEISEMRDAGKVEEEKALIGQATDEWSKRVFDVFNWNIEVYGKENIPRDDACVFISNHQGYADIMAILRSMEGKQVGFIAKDSFKKVPYLGKWIGLIRGVFIKRGNPREALRSFSKGYEYLREGFSLVIFPEGTRSKGPEMSQFKAGSFKLATKGKVQIVPVALDGTYKVFEETEKIMENVSMRIKFLPPIDTVKLDRHETAIIHTTVEELIRSALSELQKEEI